SKLPACCSASSMVCTRPAVSRLRLYSLIRSPGRACAEKPRLRKWLPISRHKATMRALSAALACGRALAISSSMVVLVLMAWSPWLPLSVPANVARILLRFTFQCGRGQQEVLGALVAQDGFGICHGVVHALAQRQLPDGAFRKRIGKGVPGAG